MGSFLVCVESLRLASLRRGHAFPPFETKRLGILRCTMGS
jgi:hypothetical protein